MAWPAIPPALKTQRRPRLAGRWARAALPTLALVLAALPADPAAARAAPPADLAAASADSAGAAPDSAAAAADSAAAYARPSEPPAIRRPADWETLATGLPEEARFRPVVRFRYNRVDGPAPTLGAAFVTARGPAPVLSAEGTYAFSRERFLFEAGFEEPIGAPVKLRAGGSIYRRTATEDAWIVGEGENTIFALLARTDYRDYYETEGIQGFVAWTPGSDFALRLTVHSESQDPLRTRTRVSAFGKDDTFRPNPPIERGQDRSYEIAARLGPGSLPLRGGTNGEVAWERSGDPLTSDFDFGRARLSARTRFRLAPAQELRARFLTGFTFRGTLPLQKIWHLGGIGTLRAHDFKELSGDRYFLANAEYYRRARKNLYAFAFLDCGAAWFGEGNLGRQRPALDGGLGIRVSEGPAAVTLAKDLRDPDAPLKVGVRLGGAF